MPVRLTSTIKIPVTGKSYKNVSPILTPVLFMLDGETRGPFVELATYCHGLLQTSPKNSRKINELVASMKRLLNLYDIVLDGALLDEDSLSSLLITYGAARIMGTKAFLDDSVIELNWKPVSANCARNEVRLLVKFFNHCHEEYGHVLPQMESMDHQLDYYDPETLFRRQDDFLAHLNKQKKAWASMINQDIVQMPSFLKPDTPQRLSREQRMINRDELIEIIKLEMNPVFRSIYIILGYGGLRACEPLHFWQQDFLHKEAWGQHFGAHHSFPLVLRCHPAKSTYIRSLGNQKTKRDAYLAEKYGLQPRNNHQKDAPNYAGWKGTMSQHPSYLMPTYFMAHDTPTYEMMRMFLEDAIAEIKDFHRINNTSNIHPYFFCNMTSKRAADFGNPTTMRNLQSAWNRSVERSGRQPHRHNRNLHALRHHYFANARKKKFTEKQIQQFIGHSTLEAQRAYGSEISEIADWMAK